MTDRIITTHAGSLPRPEDIAEMVWAHVEGKEIDRSKLDSRLDEGVAEVVKKQRDAGVDKVSDGELSKPGFSTYVSDRFTGFSGQSEFQSDDVAPFPNLAMRLFATDAMAHTIFANCTGPVELKDKQSVLDDIARFTRTLDDAGIPLTDGFMGAISPGQIAFNYPDQHYGSHEKYLERLAEVLSYEYKAITDAGLTLEVDSPDLAMSAHCRSVGSSVGDWHTHLPLAVEALNSALEGIPPEQIRLHVCWGNYAGPHHHDVPLEEIIGEVLKAKVGTIYTEGGNPRHEHEWRVFEKTMLPDDKKIILGVIDVKTNYIEHPQVVAERLVRLANVVGKERVIAGTDCGFDTFIKFSQVDPDVVWLKLKALSDGAELASSELW